MRRAERERVAEAARLRARPGTAEARARERVGPARRSPAWLPAAAARTAAPASWPAPADPASGCSSPSLVLVQVLVWLVPPRLAARLGALRRHPRPAPAR